MKREITLDTETTGLDPAQGHRVVEIGCVELVGGMKTGQVFHAYLNPEREVPEEAFRVHGLSTAFLADKPRFAGVAERFLAFLSDSRLIIHNAAFDMKFLNYELECLGLSPIPLVRAVDTVAMARSKFPGSPASLDALCRRFDIDLSARTRHGALLDAELLAEVYQELLGGRQITLALERESASAPMVGMPAASIAAGIREFFPSPEEEEAHRQLLALLKDPLWEQAGADAS